MLSGFMVLSLVVFFIVLLGLALYVAVTVAGLVTRWVVRKANSDAGPKVNFTSDHKMTDQECHPVARTPEQVAWTDSRRRREWCSPLTSTPANPFMPCTDTSQLPTNPFLDNYQEMTTPRRQEPTRTLTSTLTQTLPSPVNEANFNQSMASPNASNSFNQSTRKIKFPDTFTGAKSNLEDWLVHFRMVAEMNEWSYEESGRQLAISLRGGALEVLRDLPADEVKDFDAIVRILKRRFEPEDREDLIKEEFKNRKRRKGESISEYGFALGRLAATAYPGMPHDWREGLIKDQFANGLTNPKQQKHVKLGVPKTLDQAMKLAMTYESITSQGDRKKPEDHQAVRTVGQSNEGHEKTDQIMKELVQGQKVIAQQLASVLNSKAFGHGNVGPTQAYRQAYPSSAPSANDRVCYNCGDPSHFVSQCPHPRKSQQSSNSGTGPRFQQQQNHAPQHQRQQGGQGSRYQNQAHHQTGFTSSRRSEN